LLICIAHRRALYKMVPDFTATCKMHKIQKNYTLSKITPVLKQNKQRNDDMLGF